MRWLMSVDERMVFLLLLIIPPFFFTPFPFTPYYSPPYYSLLPSLLLLLLAFDVHFLSFCIPIS